MTVEGDAWLSECWKPCPELPRGERIAKREADAVTQARMAAQAVDGPGEMPGQVAS